MAAAHQMRIGDGVVDLGALLAHRIGPKLIEHDGTSRGVKLHDSGRAHHRPTLAPESTLAEERAFVVDLARNGRLPDDTGVRPPFEGVDHPARAAVRHADLEDHAVVGGVVVEAAGTAVEPGRTGLDLCRAEGRHLLEGDAERLAGQRIVPGERRDPDAIEPEAPMVRARPATEDPAVPEPFADRAADRAAHTRLGDGLTGAPDVSHSVGAQEADVVEQ